ALRAAARLPDAFVGPVPVLADPLDHVGDRLPALVRDALAPEPLGDVRRVDQLTVDVELKLMRCAVADADGRGTLVSLEMVERLFRKLAASVDAVHELQRSVPVAVGRVEAAGEEAGEGLGLVREAESQERVERERGVADPRVAVVPVARAAELFGEAR